MKTFAMTNYINILIVFLVIVFMVSILTVFSSKDTYRNKKKKYLRISCLSLAILFLLGIINELVLYWFNDTGFSKISSFEMGIKIMYDIISVGIMLLATVFIYHLIKFFRRKKDPLHIETFKYMRLMAITATTTSILIIVRTVCIPLFLKICRFFDLFHQGNMTNNHQDVFLYSVPYLGLEEIVIILVTIIINMIGFVYYRTVDRMEEYDDLAR